VKSKITRTTLLQIAINILLFIIYLSPSISWAEPPKGEPAGLATIVRHDPRVDQLVPKGAKFEKIADGFNWVEGPVWDKQEQALLFSDIPSNTVYQWREGEWTKPFLMPSGYSGAVPFSGKEPGSNGLTFDMNGRLVLCKHGDRQIARLEADGKVTVLAERYDGHRINSPNDLVFKSNGDLYFTDPPFGLPKAFDDPDKAPVQGVYRVSQDGTVTLLIADIKAPNGIAFSPDEKILYVSDVDPKRAAWLAYDVKQDGTVANGRVFFDATRWRKDPFFGPDGFKVDQNGNLFGARPGGVSIFAPDGTHLGDIETGQPTSNLAWGEDGSTLFVTGGSSVYRLRLTTKGAPYTEADPISVQSVARVGFTVSDMDRSVAFYSDVLTFKKISDVEVDGPEYDRFYGVFGVRARIVRMQLGAQQIELTQFLSPPDVRPIPVPSFSNDLWFQHFAVVVRDMDLAWEQLRQHHVRQISPRPQTIPMTNPAAAGIKAIKFRDPDGHNLELLWFPKGKGNPIWKKTFSPTHPGAAGTAPVPESNLFLGIDHTAMTVRSTESSTKFYRDLLGMTVAGGTLNMGTTQQYLDSLPGARTRVTGLMAKMGPPGLEFLEYELPTAGRPFPTDSHPTDLWHWQTTLVVSDIGAAAAHMQGMGHMISSGIATFPDKVLGFGKGFLVRDSDGHAMQIVSP
jgi:gluconolactonase